ncbi:Cobalt-zinc-cadmium resistance protein [Alloalcanivorax xenomutans]|uniref:cation diffusion facilitator family transporter n=1 Tax=Alloalcanivorax xenomutans TaxID=1094342 RepID=UPI0006D5BBD6|nr:cation diffusion facilitator family transporter [Alloalcanivorax xenomutans]PHS69245.1 MAG: divalent metal cation transporter FieF [Alcanivorax sp.]CUR48709.1 Cobalt-zinc-cadmium resistance protein [Alloalcanivorax xenomutans]
MTDHSHASHRLLLLAASASVAVAMVLIVVKALAWSATGSVSLLASLVDSAMDSLASLVNFAAIRYSLVPPDEEHRFGHGKAEALAGLGQAVLIAGSAVFLGREAILKMLDPQPLEATGLGIGVMVFSIVLTGALVIFQRHVIRRTGSTAIQADSLHYFSDLAVNLGIIATLVIAGFGFPEADGIVAMLIAVFVLRSAWHIGWEASQLLLDREVEGDTRDRIGAIVGAHTDALGFHDLRTRLSGRTLFIQLHVDMDQTMSLLDAHALGERIRLDIRKAFPNAEVIIHQDPVPGAPRVPVDERRDV